MQSEPRQTQAEPQRLHPASLIFSVGSAVRGWAVPGIIFIFAAGRGRGSIEFWVLLLLVPAVAVAAIKYLSFRYKLGDEELVIREGIVTRNERHIPYHRIQNIDLVQNPLHRALKVAEVRLETAGGEEPEAVIRVLSLASVDRMRARVFAERDLAERSLPTGEAREAASACLVHEMPPREVVMFGVISNQGMVVVAALLGLIWQFGEPDDWFEPFFEDLFKRIPELRPAYSLWATVLAVVAFLVVLIVVLRVLSISWALLSLHGFTLTRRGEDLRAEYGMLTRRSKTVSRQRIQIVSSRETPLHRLFGRAAIQVETAGSAGENATSTADRTWLAPLVHRVDLARLFREALPGFELNDLEWQGVAPKAFRRILRRSLILGIVPTTGLVIGLGAWGLVPAALFVPWAWVHARLYVRHTGYALGPDAVVYRSGWWVRRISVARFSRIQALELAATPFDRRNRMASIRVDTAGAGRVGHRIAVGFLEAATALRLYDRLYEEAGRTAFRW